MFSWQHTFITIKIVMLSVLLAGCVTTEKAERAPIMDNRPTVAFTAIQRPPQDIQVFVNNLMFGVVADYTTDAQPLRLLTGEQELELKYQGESIYKETLQLSQGSHHVVFLGEEPQVEVVSQATETADRPL